MSPSFENIISKFKASTKQAADQMSRAAKMAKLRIDCRTLTGERSRHFQEIGSRAWDIYAGKGTLDGAEFQKSMSGEFTQIERLNKRIAELEEEIAALQAHTGEQDNDSPDVDAQDVREV